ncbi:uncharacterized protein Z520_03875 [Fonsecaea multimorphosa CBS 102226]|uniref:RRM domain-containing protein n=1 Tax=Fonsecaea multimorphosa CBS 102226 TaxID=1442371 RepID=A0A0D2KAJ2_9EURO|nr:uncharacterized protein Z520_03875 [Fonsecaea multimorphosa CBS 102226]KIY00190.1 hypothetical protein Z520_03875 [Fonsecaea multimorphosa CBS 102226]OAL27385.1 hypothetical protein AYO22_03660 [Fonsecaea multimorphosa]
MSKKRKRDQVQDQDQDGSITAHGQSDQKSQTTAPNPPVKSKGQLKQEKSERRAKKQKKSKDQKREQEPSPALGTANSDPVPTSTEISLGDAEQQENLAKPRKERKDSTTQKDEGEKNTTTPTRFIVFVGNLPFETTSEQIKEHFSKLAPTAVRHSTDKKTGKSKGFAFVEFDSYDKMKTCLKLYHHSMFDPASSKDRGAGGADGERNGQEQPSQRREKKSKGRRINVELTAGGGGKGKDRKAKIKTKNEKLKEERERRRLKEKAEREKAGSKQKGPPETGANATAVAGGKVQDDRGDIHPSRLSRVKH